MHFPVCREHYPSFRHWPGGNNFHNLHYVFLALYYSRGTSSEPRPGNWPFHIPAAALFAITSPITGVSVVQCLRPRQSSRAVKEPSRSLTVQGEDN